MKEFTFQLCEEADEPTGKIDHIAEIKEDGRRVMVVKENDNIYLWGRDPINKEHFPEIVEAFKRIPGNFIVDCEFAVFTNQLKTDRGLLQSRDRTNDKFKMRLLKEKYPATAVILDMLEFNGQNLRNEEYQKRKQQIREAFNGIPFDIEGFKEPIKISKGMVPKEAWELAQKHQLEGIVEKDIHSKYTGKRSPDWVKIKRRETFILKFTGYDISPVGITLTNHEGFRVAVNGEKHKKVKDRLDKQGYVIAQVRGMAGKTEKGRIREIVYDSIIEGNGGDTNGG